MVNAHSKKPFGTCNQEDLRARTGKRAPKEEPTKMMNMEATRRPKRSFAPVVEPQSDDMLVWWMEGLCVSYCW